MRYEDIVISELQHAREGPEHRDILANQQDRLEFAACFVAGLQGTSRFRTCTSVPKNLRPADLP